MAKGITNPQRPEIKNDLTAQQEQCSVVAIYYYMTNTLQKMQTAPMQDKLFTAFKNIYPDIDKTKEGLKWKSTFVEQAKKFKTNNPKWYKQGVPYQYGWWDAPPQVARSTKFAREIGGGSVTPVMTMIWDKYFDKETRALFGNKKDTWNTADMYLLRKGAGSEILRTVRELKKTFVDECCADRGTFIGTLNTYLTVLLKQKILIPISLKKKTEGVNITITPTNMHEWDESGGLNIVESEFQKSPQGPGAYPWAYFNVKNQGGTLKFGGSTARTGNSFQYFASFKIGTYETEYLVEQRLTNSGTKAEVKEIKLNNKGEKVRAAAQAGSVPMPAFRDLIEEYVEPYEQDVPSVNVPLSGPQLDKWKQYLVEVDGNKAVGHDLNGFKVFDQEYPITGSTGTVTWLDKVDEIDKAYLKDKSAAAKLYGGASIGKFHQQYRLKLMQLRFLKALQVAKSRGELDKLIVHIFYLAAKQNIKDGDIHGPFLKIS